LINFYVVITPEEGGYGKMKGSTLTLVIVIAAVLVLAYVASSVDFSGKPGITAYTGRIQLNLVQTKRIDGSAYGFANSQIRLIHGSLDYNDLVTTVSNDQATGEMKSADHGTWYLIIDYGTNNTCWLDALETAKNAHVKRVFGFDGDQDGFLEPTIELYLGDLAPLTAGEDKKVVDLNIINDPARVSSITFTSLTNATGIATDAYGYYVSTGYMVGFSEGDLASLAKVNLEFTDTGNNTYPDTNYWTLISLKMGSFYTWGTQEFGGYDLANKRYQAMFGDQINALGGKPVYKAKNAGDLWCTYELKTYAKFPSASKTIVVHMKFYFYQPDGSLTSAVERTVDFSS
jgi:hypothetical protein